MCRVARYRLSGEKQKARISAVVVITNRKPLTDNVYNPLITLHKIGVLQLHMTPNARQFHAFTVPRMAENRHCARRLFWLYTRVSYYRILWGKAPTGCPGKKREPLAPLSNPLLAPPIRDGSAPQKQGRRAETVKGLHAPSDEAK